MADRYRRGALRFTNSGTRVEHIFDAELGSQADTESPHRVMTVSIDGTTLSFHVDCPVRDPEFGSDR